ncbi:MAG: hypothetical protein Q4D79_03275 [Propionibacteriaceae bacterium]|nr:hypothetical protein [Propionibacteriaceae bacterium]
MGDLAVDLHETRIGYLRGPWRTFDFHPSADFVGFPVAWASHQRHGTAAWHLQR